MKQGEAGILTPMQWEGNPEALVGTCAPGSGRTPCRLSSIDGDQSEAVVPCRDLPLPPTTFPEEGEVTATEGLGPQRYIGLWQACRCPLGAGVLPPSLHSAPLIVILVSQGMRVLYFVETLCLRAGAMAQINYDEDWESGVEVVKYERKNQLQ